MFIRQIQANQRFETTLEIAEQSLTPFVFPTKP